MKILHLLSSTGYHGAENMVTELVRQLSKIGVENHLGVLYGQQKSNKDILEAAGGYVANGVILPCGGRFDFKTVFLLRGYLRNHGIEIIHSHKYKTNLYSVLASAGTDTKLVSTCHNWLGESIKMRLYAGLDKLILKRFDAAVGVSDEVVGELKRHLSQGAVYKVGNGVDLGRFKRMTPKDDAKQALGLKGKTVIGFVGRLSADKGVSYLLAAIKRLLDQKTDVYCIIIGDGEYGDILKKEAASTGIADRVVFTGNRNDTPLLYSAMDIFVLPSLKEAFPMVVIEAMSCGLPVIATRVGDIPGIIEDNVTGFLVEPRDPDAISEQIFSLLSDAPGREAVGMAASKAAGSRYSSAGMAGKYKNIYKKILDRK